ncbi:AbgT family transporter, partial [Bacillus sp. CRN 9]|nr:AbgT family transporter [Bacillus sp. CRN 9]
MSALANQQEPAPQKRKMSDRFLDAIERAGNKLPDPVTLFVIMSG